jgi:hypothetical protein
MEFITDWIIFSKAFLTSFSFTFTSSGTKVRQSTFVANLVAFARDCFCRCLSEFASQSFNRCLGLGRHIPCLLLASLELPMDFKHKNKYMVHDVSATWLQCTLLLN